VSSSAVPVLTGPAVLFDWPRSWDRSHDPTTESSDVQVAGIVLTTRRPGPG